MKPLSEEMRPQSLDDFVGQEHVLSEGKPLYEAIKEDRLFSFVLYAPPGCGKTSLCSLIRKTTKNRFKSISAVTSGVKDLKAIIEEARMWQARENIDLVLFIDEIHRFNKGQQDALLGAVEKGEIILIGATTENPSFELNSALLSRLRVFRMESLQKEDLLKILKRAEESLKDRDGISIEKDALERISELSQGDARTALNALEQALPEVSLKKINALFAKKALYHDKSGDMHYQVVSAFIKSMRSSQPEAALYYMARMWEAGEDPLFIARRMVIFASEDIGNADLRAIALANAVRHAVEFIGRPECYYALSQGVIYLSRATKSREVGNLFDNALSKVSREGSLPPPKFLVNAVTKLDRELGRGQKRKEGESFLPLGL